MSSDGAPPSDWSGDTNKLHVPQSKVASCSADSFLCAFSTACSADVYQVIMLNAMLVSEHGAAVKDQTKPFFPPAPFQN